MTVSASAYSFAALAEEARQIEAERALKQHHAQELARQIESRIKAKADKPRPVRQPPVKVKRK